MTNPQPASTGSDLFRFAELVLIVVFGVLVATVPETVVELGMGDASSLLAIAMLVIFIEAYLVLYTYHRRLKMRYDLTLLVSDLVLVGLYVGLVRLIEAGLLANAMWLGIIVFVLLFVRQLGLYLRVGTARLEAEGMTKAELLTPMIADFVAVALSAGVLVAVSYSGFLGMSVVVWAALGFAGSILYFVIKYLLVIHVSFGRGT